jgi:hypothetical protein
VMETFVWTYTTEARGRQTEPATPQIGISNAACGGDKCPWAA